MFPPVLLCSADALQEHQQVFPWKSSNSLKNTPTLTCTKNILSPKTSYHVLKSLPALLTDFTVYSFLPLQPLLCLTTRVKSEGRYFFFALCLNKVYYYEVLVQNRKYRCHQNPKNDNMVTGLPVMVAKLKQ